MLVIKAIPKMLCVFVTIYLVVAYLFILSLSVNYKKSKTES